MCKRLLADKYMLYNETEGYTRFRSPWKPEAIVSWVHSTKVSIQVSMVIYVSYTRMVSSYV